jgi:hypothetical protein
MMDPRPPAGRPVIVLGRRATLDVEDAIRRAIADHVHLVLLSVGYPVSPAQDAIVQEAVRLSHALHASIDAMLVPSVTDVPMYLVEAAQIEIVAAGADRRRLERIVVPTSHRPASAVRQALLPELVAVAAAGSSEGRTPVGSGAPPALDAGAEADAATGYGPGMATADTGSESVEALAGRDVPQPLIDTVWTREESVAAKKGRLIVYLGAAPGVGKTYAMLSEGQRAKARGTDVVVAVAQTYDRPRTIEMLEGLEVVPARRITYRGTEFDEMDAEAVIERRPERVLVDELAHTNIPGSRRAKRWEDVLDILAEGITVITTLNIQHLSSLNDVVAQVTGVRQQETVPDWILDLADQVELVDMSPHALQRRMIHGNVYPDTRKSELALQRFFTTENLTALRDLALMRVANQVDDHLLRRWSKTGSAPDTRERILVCVSNPTVSEELIRRGARIAQRSRGDLLVVHAAAKGSEPDPTWVAACQRLARELGGEFHVIPTDDEPVQTILSFAYQQAVTQILVWESLRSRWQEIFGGSFTNRLIRHATNIDIHVIARSEK